MDKTVRYFGVWVLIVYTLAMAFGIGHVVGQKHGSEQALQRVIERLHQISEDRAKMMEVDK